MLSTLKYPTVTEFYTALINANKTFETSDNRKLAEYLVLALIKNSRLRGHVLTRRTAIQSWDWDIIPIDSTQSEVAIQAKLRLSNVIKSFIKSRISVPLFGFLVLEVGWKLIDNSRVPYLVKSYEPTDIISAKTGAAIIADGNDKKQKSVNSEDILNNSGNYEQILTIIDTDEEYFRGGLLASAMLNEILRLDMLEEWALWAKKQKGLIHGIDRGADEQERSEAETAMRTLLKNNYMISSEYIEFKFEQIANSVAGGSFKELINELNSSISIALLGQANTSELPRGGGSRAALEVQRLVSADIMYSDVIATENLINEQLLPCDYAFNYSNGVVPYKFKINLAESNDFESAVTVASEAISAGIPLKKYEVYEKIGYTIPKENDEVISSNALS